jgi:hypothetical protein
LRNENIDSDKVRAIADLVRRFASGTVTTYEWDDVMGIAFHDAVLEELRRRATLLDFARDSDAMELLLRIADELEEYARKI